MRSHVSGADLHKYAGHLIAIDGILAQLLWADPEDNGLLVRVRTAERGREYLVRADPYAVSENPEPILSDDATDRWDNEPAKPERDPVEQREIDIDLVEDALDGYLRQHGDELASPHDLVTDLSASELLDVLHRAGLLRVPTRPNAIKGGEVR